MNITWKIICFDTVLRSKLFYGMDSLYLIPSLRPRLDAFQFKTLRRILNLDATFINRANSSVNVLEKANKLLEEYAIAQKKPIKEITKFSDYYKKIKIKRLINLIENEGNIIQKITYDQISLGPLNYGTRRPGRPRYDWINYTLKEYWEVIQESLGNSTLAHPFNPKNPTHITTIRRAAAQNFCDPKMQKYIP